MLGVQETHVLNKGGHGGMKGLGENREKGRDLLIEKETVYVSAFVQTV